MRPDQTLVAAPSAEQPYTSRRSPWREAAVVAAICTALLCLFYVEIIFQGKTLLPLQAPGVMGPHGPYGVSQPLKSDPYRPDPGASSWAMEPWAAKVAYEYSHGRFPLWNDHQGFGTPLLANAQSGAFDLLRLPAIISRASLAWDLYYLLRAAGGLVATYLFARTIGLVRPAGLFLAIAYVFSGHFMLFGNNTWVEAYLLLPVSLLGTEWLISGRMRYGFVVTALSVMLNINVGMPEATLFVLLFAAGYGGLRLLERGWLTGFGRPWLRQLVVLTGAWLTGIGLAAPLLLTLLEYVNHSAKRVSERMIIGQHYEAWRFFYVWIEPHLNGRPLEPGSTHTISTYAGMTVVFLAIYGLIPSRMPIYRRLAPFALLVAALLLAKTYGVPGINELGRLPIFNVTIIPKWSGPVTGFALALLASLGVHRLVIAPARPALIGATLLTASGLATLGLVANWEITAQVKTVPIWATFGLAMLVAATAWTIASLRARLPATIIGSGLCLLVTAELFALSPHDVYQPRSDRYTVPPYLEFLRQQSTDQPFRIFARDKYLYPNAASVFGLDDIRSLDALYVDRYLAYIMNLINPGVFDRFTGYLSDSGGKETRLLDNPWLNLAGVRYLITDPGSAWALALRGGLFADEVAPTTKATCTGRPPPCFQMDSLTVNGATKTFLFQHPPATIQHPVMITPDAYLLRFSVALNPKVWSPQQGDGVGFVIAIERGGRREVVYRRQVDPKHNVADQRWIDGQVDLTRYIGQTITLVFVTEPLQSGAFDWAGWGDLRLEGSTPRTTSQYTLIYDSDVKIFENRRVLPRAFLVGQVVPVPTMDAAIDAAKNNAVDPAVGAIVEGAPPDRVAALTGATGLATFRERASTRLKLEVEANEPTFLVLTDALFPGWVATIDGTETPIYPTNIAFRGLFVPPGRHEIIFEYRPMSFFAGLSIALVAGLVLTAVVGSGIIARLALWQRRRSSQRPGIETTVTQTASTE